MNRIFLSITVFFILISCNDKSTNKLPTDVVTISASADSSNSSTDMPQIVFEENMHNFGKITEGEVVEYAFKFENTGNADLLITNAAGSCGCTVPEYPKELIAPGKGGIMKVKFDSDNKSGTFEKTVTVTCNTEPRETVLTITGDVIPKK